MRLPHETIFWGYLMSTKQYVIRVGAEGRERLRLLSSIMRPTTLALLSRAGILRDASCLDVGCGGGDVNWPFACNL
jgi:2-polyprenyl-3-methyl-5-hydroxy-6-metoxy-1,4-benzoquinol methylase